MLAALDSPVSGHHETTKSTAVLARQHGRQHRRRVEPGHNDLATVCANVAPKVGHHLADGEGVLVNDEPNPRQPDHASCGQVVHDSEVDCLLHLVLGQLVPLGDLRDGVATEDHAREGLGSEGRCESR